MGKLSALAHKIGRSCHRLRWATALAGIGLGVAIAPAHAAEEIIITYGLLERTVPIQDLEAFAEGRGLSRQLNEYAENIGLTDRELTTIQQVLNSQAEISETDVAQFLYTTQGKTILKLVGEVVQTPSRLSGFYAIRAGLILAAADDDEGLTVINFLRKYPTPAIRIDIGKGLEIASAITETLDDAEQAIALVRALADEAAQQGLLTDLSATRQLVYALPPFEVDTRELTIPSRGVQGTLFLPQTRLPNQTLPNDIPVIVISHGLGDERTSYVYLADFLARRGFAVATLDHPGSNSQQIAQLLAELSTDLINNQEFLSRPADISALLDEIQQFADDSSQFRDRLNFNNVGVIGQSFGGYTALALAGATYDFETLTQVCEPQPIYLNPSLLLQCQAEGLRAESFNLRDERVGAIFVVNPVGSGIFGPAGFANIDVPTFIMAATADTVAPALPEQIKPFTWLNTEDRYLALVSNTTHFSVIDWNAEVEPTIPVPTPLLGDSPALAQDYLQTLSLAFFQQYLNQDPSYAPALTAQFINDSVARSPLTPLSLLQELSPDLLDQAIEGEGVFSDSSAGKLP